MPYKLFFLAMSFCIPAQADFGEVDLVVREAIEIYSSQNNLNLDMSTLIYDSQKPISTQGNALTVLTQIDAQPTAKTKAIYQCSTDLRLSSLEHMHTLCVEHELIVLD